MPRRAWHGQRGMHPALWAHVLPHLSQDLVGSIPGQKLSGLQVIIACHAPFFSMSLVLFPYSGAPLP